MIEKILNKLGYIKISIVEEVDFPISAEDRLFKDLSGVDGFQDYLNSIASKDTKRYFMAETEKQRDIIKGGFSRIVYIKSRLDKTI